MLVYQSLKFQGNRKHGVLNPSDLPWNTPYILVFVCLVGVSLVLAVNREEKKFSLSNRPDVSQAD